MDLAFRMFNRYELVNQGDVLGYASVWMGEKGVVPLTVSNDINRVLSKASADTVTTQTDWPSSVSAPIAKGQELGQLTLNIDGEMHHYPLVA